MAAPRLGVSLFCRERIRGDIARTSLKIRHHAPPVGAPSYKSGTDGGKVNVNVSDPRVRIIALRPLSKDDYGFARLDHGKTFANGGDHRPSGDRDTRRGMVGKMNRRPRPQLMVVGQCRKSFERKLLRIDQGLCRQSVMRRHHQFPLVLKEDRALRQTIVRKREPAERRIDFAGCHGFNWSSSVSSTQSTSTSNLLLSRRTNGKVNS